MNCMVLDLLDFLPEPLRCYLLLGDASTENKGLYHLRNYRNDVVATMVIISVMWSAESFYRCQKTISLCTLTAQASLLITRLQLDR